MVRLLSLIIILFTFCAAPVWPQSVEPLRHDLKVWLDPDHKHLVVEDHITVPESFLASSGNALHFLLHAGLKPQSLTPGVTIIASGEKPSASHFGADFDPLGLPGNLEFFHVTPDRRDFVLKYEGSLHHPPEKKDGERARSFSETSGTVSSEGVFLAGSSYWYPWFGNLPLTFAMDVRLPPGWDAVSQGRRPLHDRDENGVRTRWESPEPQYEIFLLAGKYTEYSRQAGRVEALVFLRKADENLANRYLDVTGQYLEMYAKLFGAYPYRKFALVENFWETGYGMPSFTLLGPRVIRFPFILHSSYPHEILHNWWGNGVYADPRTGNWAEGLTAYLADHLIKEQRGQAVAYRRTTLRKYTDYVSSAKDFPLTQFRSRHSSATEAVGYGKSLMIFHMLRQRLGDTAFVGRLRQFYKQYKFRQASYDDIRGAFANAGDLKHFFDQWVASPGAPKLEVGNAEVVADGDGFILKADLQQVQEGAAYRLDVPLAVTLEGSARAYQTTVVMNGKHHALQLRLPARPLRLDVDPEFDVFRRLDRYEIPPALTQVFGAEKILMVLPASETAMLDSFRDLAKAFGGRDSAEIKLDNEIGELPADRTVWLFGWNNRFRGQFFSALEGYHVAANENAVGMGSATVQRAGNSLVLTARHPGNPELAVAWVGTENPAAIPGLARKLPHYHKYSYLAFKGDEPANFQKGQWPVLNSPMTVFLPRGDGATAQVVRAKLDSRKALADLPPVFSKASMMKTIRHLSAEAFKGRGFGSPELDRAADFIAERFRSAGLLPGGDQGYFQTWTERGGDPQVEATMKNVVAILPGTKAEWQGQSVVVAAHYDHLGLGWPDVREGNKGKIHPGADDNASGVTVLLELARVLGKSLKPDRTVIFVAFTGEESKLRGSKFYVANARRFPVNQIMGMVNMDTVGRLGENKLTVFGTGSTTEWSHIFRGVGFVTGVKVRTVADDLGASDQKSFLDAGVPAVQIFSGVNLDYHSPTDTADKIDADGLVKVAVVVKETVEYLSGRDKPMTSTLSGKGSSVSASTTQGARKVSLGTVPDFAYEGQGVRLEDIVPVSPAEKAGLVGGDIIKQINTAAINGLRDLSEFLKTLKPGDRISITFTRNGKEQETRAEVTAR